MEDGAAINQCLRETPREPEVELSQGQWAKRRPGQLGVGRGGGLTSRGRQVKVAGKPRGGRGISRHPRGRARYPDSYFLWALLSIRARLSLLGKDEGLNSREERLPAAGDVESLQEERALITRGRGGKAETTKVAH